MILRNLFLNSFYPVYKLPFSFVYYKKEISKAHTILFRGVDYFKEFVVSGGECRKAVVVDTPLRLSYFYSTYVKGEAIKDFKLVNNVFIKVDIPNLEEDFRFNGSVIIKDTFENFDNSKVLHYFINNIKITLMDRLYSYLFYFESRSIEKMLFKYVKGSITLEQFKQSVKSLESNETLVNEFICFVESKFSKVIPYILHKRLDKSIKISVKELKFIRKYFREKLKLKGGK